MPELTTRPIERLSRAKTVTWDQSEDADNSSALDIRHFDKAAILFTSEFNTDTVTIQGCDTSSGTFRTIKNSGGTNLTITGATNTWVELPSAAMGMPYIRFQTGTSVAADATLTVALKS